MLCPMANGMYGREELSPVICLFLSDGNALCRVPVIPEIYPKPSHHSRLRMDLRRAVGVDGFPSLRYILINDFCDAPPPSLDHTCLFCVSWAAGCGAWGGMGGVG